MSDDAEKMMELSEQIGAARSDAPPPLAAPVVLEPAPEPPAKSPAHRALRDSRFRFVRAEQGAGAVAYGYSHQDGRGAMLTVSDDGTEMWFLRHVDGAEFRGTSPTQLRGYLRGTTARRAHAKLRAEEAVEKAVKKTDAAKALVAAAKERLLPEGPPDHVMHALEMLRGLTDGRYDVQALRGDKHYSDRMALLRVLFNRERGQTKAAEVGVNNVAACFYTAVGVAEGSAAARTKEFAARCEALLKAWAKAKERVEKARQHVGRVRRRATAKVVPGTVLPAPRLKSAKKRAKELEDLRGELAAKTAAPVELAAADPEAELRYITASHLRCVAYKNGTVGVLLEPYNSQGALCLTNNGARVCVGVLTPVLAEGAKVAKHDPEAALAALEGMEGTALERSERADKMVKKAKRVLKAASAPASLAPVDPQAKTPRPGADEPVIRAAHVKLLEDPEFGLVLLQLEKENSQGALCVYNNGKAVIDGVVPPEILRTLRPLPGADVLKAANQFLNPIVPSVPVTPTASRHLTAVTNCKELINMANASKFAPPVRTAQKDIGKPVVRPVKEQKLSKKAAKEEKAVKEEKALKSKKAAGAPRVAGGHTYVLANEKALGEHRSPQLAFIVDHLKKAGKAGATKADIVAAAVKAGQEKFPTNQPHDRAIGFYLSKFKGLGALKFAN